MEQKKTKQAAAQGGVPKDPILRKLLQDPTNEENWTKVYHKLLHPRVVDEKFLQFLQEAQSIAQVLNPRLRRELLSVVGKTYVVHHDIKKAEQIRDKLKQETQDDEHYKDLSQRIKIYRRLFGHITQDVTQDTTQHATLQGGVPTTTQHQGGGGPKHKKVILFLQGDDPQHAYDRGDQGWFKIIQKDFVDKFELKHTLVKSLEGVRKCLKDIFDHHQQIAYLVVMAHGNEKEIFLSDRNVITIRTPSFHRFVDYLQPVLLPTASILLHGCGLGKGGPRQINFAQQLSLALPGHKIYAAEKEISRDELQVTRFQLDQNDIIHSQFKLPRPNKMYEFLGKTVRQQLDQLDGGKETFDATIKRSIKQLKHILKLGRDKGFKKQLEKSSLFSILHFLQTGPQIIAQNLDTTDNNVLKLEYKPTKGSPFFHAGLHEQGNDRHANNETFVTNLLIAAKNVDMLSQYIEEDPNNMDLKLVESFTSEGCLDHRISSIPDKIENHKKMKSPFKQLQQYIHDQKIQTPTLNPLQLKKQQNDRHRHKFYQIYKILKGNLQNIPEHVPPFKTFDEFLHSIFKFYKIIDGTYQQVPQGAGKVVIPGGLHRRDAEKVVVHHRGDAAAAQGGGGNRPLDPNDLVIQALLKVAKEPEQAQKIVSMPNFPATERPNLLTSLARTYLEHEKLENAQKIINIHDFPTEPRPNFLYMLATRYAKKGNFKKAKQISEGLQLELKTQLLQFITMKEQKANGSTTKRRFT